MFIKNISFLFVGVLLLNVPYLFSMEAMLKEGGFRHLPIVTILGYIIQKNDEYDTEDCLKILGFKDKTEDIAKYSVDEKKILKQTYIDQLGHSDELLKNFVLKYYGSLFNIVINDTLWQNSILSSYNGYRFFVLIKIMYIKKSVSKTNVEKKQNEQQFFTLTEQQTVLPDAFYSFIIKSFNRQYEEINNKCFENSRLNEENNKKDKDINRLNGEVDEKDKQIKKLEAAVRNKEAEIKELKAIKKSLEEKDSVKSIQEYERFMKVLIVFWMLSITFIYYLK